MDRYSVIGLMSGTSLDGLDIAFCDFTLDKTWSFQLLEAETVNYSPEMKEKLSSLSDGTAKELAEYHVYFGKFCGERVAEFVKRKKMTPDFVASHGHTIFHQPGIGLTLQIGEGAALAAASGFPVVCDFRSGDIALGGQGAPLVPIGDRLLFGRYTYCLNLGGIANISFESGGNRIAFDVCACNILLNYLAQKSGKAFDLNGEMAAAGKVHPGMLAKFNSLEYYSRPFPKSLGREDVDRDLIRFFEKNEFNLPLEDLMATAVEHIARQIGNNTGAGTMLVTGGGVFNTFLIQRLKEFTATEVIVPDPEIVNYKEALIFAFLGLKRWRSEVNCLKSVTGASRDNIGGAIYPGGVI